MTKMQFTFGIELELVCVFKRCSFQKFLGFDPDPEELEDESVISSYVLALCLSQAGLKASSTGEDVPYTMWNVKHDYSVRLTTAEDRHLPWTETEKWISEDIEIVSPILSSNTSEWQEQLKTVLGTLQRMTETLDCYFLVNSTTGLHIHLGNNGGDEFPLDFSKRILQFMTAFERNLDTIHPARRLHAPGLDDTLDAMGMSCNPLSYFHKYNSKDPKGGNVFSWLHKIETAETIEELGKVTTASMDYKSWKISLTGHDSTVNLDNLFKADKQENPINTIEFRQHAGSLDFIEITSWISLLLRMAEFCQEVSDPDFINLLIESVNPKFNLNDLLTAIGCDVDTRLYYGLRPSIQALPKRHRCLDDLVKQNTSDRTQAREETPSRVEKKYVNSYYGIDPLSCNTMPWESVKELLESNFPAYDGHIARSIVLEELAKMYGARN